MTAAQKRAGRRSMELDTIEQKRLVMEAIELAYRLGYLAALRARKPAKKKGKAKR